VRSFFRISVSSLVRYSVAALLACVAIQAGAQGYRVFHILSPYEGNPPNPLDPSRAALGTTFAEACGQRSLYEMSGFGAHTQAQTATYVGILPNGSCGFLWLNATHNEIAPFSFANEFSVSCAEYSDNFFYPKPPWPQAPLCTIDCPANQKDPATGLCWTSTPKNAGPPCPKCANPVNPATGNKYQAETDIAGRADGPPGFVRHYNSGVPVHNRVLGGKWNHPYNSRIILGPQTLAVAHRPEGRQERFTLQGSAWVAEADIADRLTELKDAQGVRSGWRYYLAASDSTEHYHASGYLTAIENRSGLTQTLVYSDGTNGASSGNGGFVLDAAGNPTTAVLPKGSLLRIRDHFGRSLSFGYDSVGRIVKVADPAGAAYLYGYGLNNNLTSVAYPGGAQRTYHYNEPANTSGSSKPFALTGITDENGARFATYKYDRFGRAIESVHHADGMDVNRYQLVYDVSGVQTTVTDPRGTPRTFGFQTILGNLKNTALSQPEAGALGSALSYDANGNVSSRTDFNGNRTNYAYDLAKNLETSRSEGLTSGGGTTPHTRTISTQWHGSFRLPAEIAEPLRKTTFVYDVDGTECGARGALCSKTIQATTDLNGSQGFSATPSGTPRTWTYTYNSNGFVLTVNGPRTDVSDVTTHTYYANNASCPTANGGHATGCRGQVETVTNALSQTTSITAYNAHGQPLTIVDPNNLTTTMTYDARQRLETRTVGTETTTYEYDLIGQLTKVTLPDGSLLSYTYDSAHRLTAIEDNLDNRISYTLDAMGNRTLEQVRDPANQLAQKRSRVYNALNRLFQELGAQNQTTEYTYDDQGNILTVKDPLNHTTTNQYDALNRLRQVTAPPVGNPPASPVTQYAYNGLDALIQLTDPRKLVTGYTVDGLNNLTQQASPDTGTTGNTYDAAGNLLTQADAKSQTTTYVYDALNRVTLITFHDGSKQAYAYDQGTNGIGRLSSITETNPADQVTSVLAYAYDQHGRVTSEARIVAGVQYILGYRYDSSGRLDQLTYPSGRIVNYSFDGLGRVSGVTTTKPDAQQHTVVSGVTYHPFGGVKGYTLGNGQVYTRGIDLDGRIASYTLGAQSFALGYDAASRIEFISETAIPPNANTYGYDNLDRLTSVSRPGGAVYGYEYDAVGNRTASNAAQYTYSSTSNRLASIVPTSGPIRNFVFDANGSITADGNNTYVYDTRGRMMQATSTIGATNYQVNALGQRTRKTNSLGDTVFHYDTQGKLIAETSPSGTLKRELIFLGDIPVGVVQ
jgi:YD repeat-containing protein